MLSDVIFKIFSKNPNHAIREYRMESFTSGKVPKKRCYSVHFTPLVAKETVILCKPFNIVRNDEVYRELTLFHILIQILWMMVAHILRHRQLSKILFDRLYNSARL